MRDFLREYYDVQNYSFFNENFDVEALRKELLDNHEIEDYLNICLGSLGDFDKKSVDIEFSNKTKKRRTKPFHYPIRNAKEKVNGIINKISDELESPFGPLCDSRKIYEPLLDIYDILGQFPGTYLKKEEASELNERIGYFNKQYQKISAPEELDKEAKEIVDSLLDIPVEYTVLGEFNPKTKHIILYLKSICQRWVNNNVSEVLMSVLAHEMFHAMHYEQLEKSNQRIAYYAYKESIVLESLADCFQYYFTNEVLGQKALAWDIYHELDGTDIEFWPYAGAKYLLQPVEDNNLKDKDKIKEVINQLEIIAKPRYSYNWLFEYIFKDSLGDIQMAYFDITKLKHAIREYI